MLSEQKLKRFNQLMLAVLLSVVALLVVIGAILWIFEMSGNYMSSSSYEQDRDEIISDNSGDEKKAEKLVSYEWPVLIDTLQKRYIIPVTIRNYTHPEKDSDDYFGNIFSRSSKGYRMKKDYYYNTGYLKNMVFYFQTEQKTVRVFNKSVTISDYIFDFFDDETIFVFQTIKGDTDKNGLLNSYDHTEIQIYSVEKQQLQKIKYPKSTVISYEFAIESKNIIIRYGLDHDSNGQYEYTAEPSVLKEYNYESSTLVDIIDDELSGKLQKMLDNEKK